MLRRALLSVLTAATMVVGFAGTAVAKPASALMPVCDQVSHNCGTVVNHADGAVLGSHLGHDIGQRLNDADVDVLLSLATRARQQTTSTAVGNTVWDRLAVCEASGNWASTVGLYEGGLQFHPQTWDAYKPAGYPAAAYQASREQQIHVAEKVLAAQGWGAWPACSSKLGLR